MPLQAVALHVRQNAPAVAFVQALRVDHGIENAGGDREPGVTVTLHRRDQNALPRNALVTVVEVPLDVGEQFQAGAELVLFLDQQFLQTRPRGRVVLVPQPGPEVANVFARNETIHRVDPGCGSNLRRPSGE